MSPLMAFDCLAWFHKVYIARASKSTEDDGYDFQNSKPTSTGKIVHHLNFVLLYIFAYCASNKVQKVLHSESGRPNGSKCVRWKNC